MSLIAEFDVFFTGFAEDVEFMAPYVVTDMTSTQEFGLAMWLQCDTCGDVLNITDGTGATLMKIQGGDALVVETQRLCQDNIYEIETRAWAATKTFNHMPRMYLYTAQTVLVIIKLTKCAVALWLRCGSCKLTFFYTISSFVAKFTNAVHSLEPGETPSY